jgi:hypothetical protein
VARLQLEIHEFKKTFLYSHFKACQTLLYEETVAQVIDEPLRSAETLYIREGWLGEDRAVRELHHWFDNLSDEIDKQMREMKNNTTQQ